MGLNYKPVSNGFRCLSPVRIIEMRLAKNCCLNDFPGYTPLKALTEYRLGIPIAERTLFPVLAVPTSDGARLKFSSKRNRSNCFRSSTVVSSRKISAVRKTPSDGY